MKRLKQGLILVLMLSMILTISCSQDVKTDLSPEDHVYEAYLNTFTKGGVDLTAKMDMKISESLLTDGSVDDGMIEPMKEVMDNMGFVMNYKIKTDLENKKFDYDLAYRVDYKEKPLLDMKMYLNFNEFGIGITNFYDRYFVLNFEDLISSVGKLGIGTEFTQLDLGKYFDIIVGKAIEHKDAVSDTKYEDMLKAHLKTHLSEGVNEVKEYEINGEKVSKNVLTYEYTMNLKDIMSLMSDMFKEMENDAEIKAVYKDIAKAVYDEFITSEDYVLLGMSESEVKITDAEFELYFEEGWKGFFEGFNEEFTNSFEAYNDETMQELQSVYDSMKYKIYVDGDTTITGIHLTAETPELSYNMDYQVNAIGDAVVIDEKPANPVKIVDYIDFENQTVNDKEGLAEIIKEFLLSSIDELQTGEGVQLLIKDLGKYEEELGFGLLAFNVALGQAKQTVEETDWVSYIDMMFNNSYDTDDYSYEEPELAELTSIAFVTIDESDLSVSLQESADSRSVEFKEYKASSPEDADVFNEAWSQGATLIFIEDERLKEAAKAATEGNLELKVIALFEEGDDYFPTNMSAISIYNEEPSYVSGYIAGLVTETNKVGFVAGTDDYDTDNHQYGFTSGVQASNPDAEVIVKALGVDDDKSLGSEVVAELNDENVDVIYHDAGAVGEGIIDAVEQYDIWAIGNDSDYGKGNKRLLTYHSPNYAGMAESILVDYDYGWYEMYYYFGAGREHVMFDQMNINDEVWTQTLELMDQIIDGSIYIDSYTSSDVSYDDPELKALTGIAFVTVDESELSATLKASADSRAIEFTEYKVSNTEDVNVFTEAMNAGATLIFIEDERLKEAAKVATESNPELQVVAMFEEGDDYFPTNMSAVSYYNEEPSYVAGYIAGLVTESNKVGFVAGTDDYDTSNHQFGFTTGLQASNPNAEVVVKNIGADDDKAAGSAVVKELNDENVDVIYHDAGTTGEGVIDAVEQYNIWAIGNNSDYGKGNKRLLTYHYYNVAGMSESIITSYENGSYDMYYYFGANRKYIMFDQVNINDEVWTQTLELIDQISSGELYIESYWAE